MFDHQVDETLLKKPSQLVFEEIALDCSSEEIEVQSSDCSTNGNKDRSNTLV